ncbi:MAG: cryptochrome/photolyase family protein [Verrucomicrobiota bacterium]
MRVLRLILGDQLSSLIPTLSGIDKHKDIVLMAEVHEEATYVTHHKKKIIFTFSAMRHFAEELKTKGYHLHYTKIDDPKNSHSLLGETKRLLQKRSVDQLFVTEAGEYRLTHAMKTQWSETLGIPVKVLQDTRFLATHEEFRNWASPRKELIMEYFYREMRKKTGLLMETNGKPVGEAWNLDKQNRKPLGKKIKLPARISFKPDSTTNEVIKIVEKLYGHHFGNSTPFGFAVTSKQAKKALDDFISRILPNFGDYQDAMKINEPFLFHSLISFYINSGLLDPLYVCFRAEKAFKEKKAPLNAVEGFIRQIIGWREYIRGIYWYYMPGYTEKNALKASESLPDFYWTAETKMRCMHEVIRITKEEAYSHHIQRLMVTGNFALLAGINPQEVHQWYLAVYADAYEWVEAPNTIGMALYADGGIVGTKPYIASGAYINRMSNFCPECHYNVKARTGKDACPFNTLYWQFLLRHKEKLKNNRRMTLAYKNLSRLSKDEEKEILRYKLPRE